MKIEIGTIVITTKDKDGDELKAPFVLLTIGTENCQVSSEQLKGALILMEGTR